MKKTLLFILFLIKYIILIKADNSQQTLLQLEGFIYDQFPLYNDNFEPAIGSLTPGMVLPNINSTTRVPDLVSLLQYTTVNQNGRMNSPNLYQYFYQSNTGAPKTTNSGLNVPMTIKLNLTLDPTRGVYVYDNQYFFPIDYQGFDVDPSYRVYNNDTQYHNFHFCLKINSKFTFQGIEVFNFIGDDDVWVFINDYLVIDLGGLHTAASKSVDLTTLTINGQKLVKGTTYNFDFFYCERHTTASTIRVETNIQTFCPFYDYCNVCRGDGSTCCSATLCDDNNICTSDICPPADTVIQPGFTIKDYCQHIPKTCAVIDKCSNNTCSMSTGQCVQQTIPCPSKAGQCMTLDKCDATQGCLYTQACTGICNTGVCNSGTCEVKSNSTCASELDNDKCKIYSCDPVKGCVSEPLCKQGSNPCIVATCSNGVCGTNTLSASECDCGCEGKLNACEKNNCVNGQCSPLRIDIDDGNACTIDVCNNSTGAVTHDPVTTCTGCNVCNPKSGTCSPTDSLCQDGNLCTDNKCVADPSNSNLGTCQSSVKSCNTTNKCLIWSCNSETGCYSTNKVCPDSGKCQVGYCDPDQGCLLKNRTCSSTAYCLVSECDESLGCITYDRRCAADNAKCQKGVCVNGTTPTNGKCESINYDPQPFVCKTAAVVSTAVVAGVVVAGAVALGAAIFAGKKGYDYWKDSQANTMTASNSNPLYEANPNGGENPLFNDTPN
ncbi:hypothetical protein DICPUDRAFT_49154 [Dictyostelium purpureum]|uniref:PA14 domain-containing protein n=1 Tax=Dictyostelium purpureum TaxID=5786 RepID=F0ZSG9_DICPU|nr:uncharacterized protein DICPUDRAFT_49154 [Dictyostelium purpureum]EGC33116.1 hypothetical protein DICPUDRAFT_49154 [Dictyostelium purpureum]|eukprot:XP_003290353.1 hypothetical protein DICPUDRAFT_49154 [Dictyostelium purpureum]